MEISEEVPWTISDVFLNQTAQTCGKTLQTNQLYKPNGNSFVWRYFRLSYEFPDLCFCLYPGCNLPKPLAYATTTSNMSAHINAKHEKKTLQSTLTKYKKCDLKQEADKNCMLWITINNRPMNIARDQYLQNWVYNLPKNYQIPSTNTLISQRQSTFAEVVEATKNEVLKYKNKCYLVADGWTEKITHTNYAGVHINYISDWKLKSLMLEMKPKEGHDQDSVNKIIDTIKEDFQIDNVKLVSDKGPDFAAAGRRLPANCWQPCASHRIHRAILQSFTKCIDPKFKRLKDKCAWISSQINDPKGNSHDIFQKKQKTYGITSKLINDCETRWWCSLKNMESIEENLQPISKVSNAFKFDEDRKILLHDVIETLKNIRTYSRDLELEKEVTISYVIPNMTKIVDALKIQKKKTHLTPWIVELLKQIRKRFFENSENYLIESTATFLDVQLKSSENLQNIVDFLIVKMNSVSTEEIQEMKAASISRDNSPVKKRKRAIYNNNTVADISKSNELNNYIQKVQKNPEEDVLVWWSVNCGLYPRLAVIAKEILACPATSTRIERAFKDSKFMVTDVRSNLKPETIKMNQVIKTNYPVLFE